MAAIFVSYTGGDMFMKNVQFSVPYGCAELSGIWTGGSPSIVTDISVQTSEILQHFTGFDDIITTLHFGKSVGAININGILFSDCTSNIPGVGKFYQTAGKYRGSAVVLSLGGFAFQGIVADTSIQLTASPDTMAYFSVRMNLVAHTLPGKK